MGYTIINGLVDLQPEKAMMTGFVQKNPFKVHKLFHKTWHDARNMARKSKSKVTLTAEISQTLNRRALAARRRAFKEAVDIDVFAQMQVFAFEALDCYHGFKCITST